MGRTPLPFAPETPLASLAARSALPPDGGEQDGRHIPGENQRQNVGHKTQEITREGELASEGDGGFGICGFFSSFPLPATPSGRFRSRESLAGWIPPGVADQAMVSREGAVAHPGRLKNGGNG